MYLRMFRLNSWMDFIHIHYSYHGEMWVRQFMT
jgi:hypothetical protein